MGCSSSKRVEADFTSDVYRPPPASIALFDISKVQEPWLLTTTDDNDDIDDDQPDKKPPPVVPLPLLAKLDTSDSEHAPQSWSEVSKALEDLKPSLHDPKPPPTPSPPAKKQPPPPQPPAIKKSNSLHTLEELDAKKTQPPPPPPPELMGHRPVKENSFLLRDRQEREKQEAAGRRWKRRDPLESYPIARPPGNPEGVVLYITSLRGVRRTFDDCERARRALEAHAADAGVGVDERDVALHGEYLKELRELVAEEGAAVPRLFVRGRYVGGAEEVVELGETGKLKEMLKTVPVKGGGVGMGGCEGCGGARFVPCLECSGSCKVVGEDGKKTVRCGKCNENGLVLCPVCH